MRWCSWLRHCAVSRKVAGSIPDTVIEIFHLLNPSGHTMAQRSIWPLKEISTGTPEAKGSRHLGLSTLTPSCPFCLEILGASDSCTSWSCPGIALPSLTHWIGGWVDLKTDADVWEKNPLSLPGIKPKFLGYPDCSVVTVWAVLSHLSGHIVSSLFSLVTVLPFPIRARSHLSF